jgi:hypothetical protein
MKFYRLVIIPMLAVAVAMLVSCSPLQQYRTSYDLCVNPTATLADECAAHAIQQLPAEDGSSYRLDFIEFDDQGQLWDRTQMTSVIDSLLTEAATKDLLMVVFVHGWKHSAAPGDGNIETFRKVLAKLSEDEQSISKLTGQPARKVAGVYLGWRGASVTAPVLENLTFWERKNTAQKIGHGGVAEVLSRLELLKGDKDSMNGGTSGTRLVVIGHSFGGAVVHTAVAQILESRFVHTTGPAGIQSNVAGFGNLVVLINPAFEAGLFTPLSDMSAERGSYFDSQLPVMAILTSEADYATRYAFPAGRRLSTLFESTRDSKRANAATGQAETIAQDEANVAAVGHFQPYRTHELYPQNAAPRDSAAVSRSEDRVRNALTAAAAWTNDSPGSKIPFAELTLERTQTSAGRNPYLVIHVDRRLIRDHNDIDDPRIIDFLKQLIAIPALPEASKQSLYRALGISPVAP